MQYAAYAFLITIRSGKLLPAACVWYALRDGNGKYKPVGYHKQMIGLLSGYRKTSVEDL